MKTILVQIYSLKQLPNNLKISWERWFVFGMPVHAPDVARFCRAVLTLPHPLPTSSPSTRYIGPWTRRCYSGIHDRRSSFSVCVCVWGMLLHVLLPILLLPVFFKTIFITDSGGNNAVLTLRLCLCHTITQKGLKDDWLDLVYTVNVFTFRLLSSI